MYRVQEELHGRPTMIGVIECQWVPKISSCVHLHFKIVTQAQNPSTALKSDFQYFLNSSFLFATRGNRSDHRTLLTKKRKFAYFWTSKHKNHPIFIQIWRWKFLYLFLISMKPLLWNRDLILATYFRCHRLIRWKFRHFSERISFKLSTTGTIVS